MESYQGIKFNCETRGVDFTYDERLETLNRWSWLFSRLGLTPVHQHGAYGNMSYRVRDDSFVITKSGMIPEENLAVEQYTLVEYFDEISGNCRVRGKNRPSSECFLHNRIYKRYGTIHAVLHGHSSLLNEWADVLHIPVTSTFCEYGTPELAESVLGIITPGEPIIIMKDHGFVAIGKDIGAAGRTTLKKYGELLHLLDGSASSGWLS